MKQFAAKNIVSSMLKILLLLALFGVIFLGLFAFSVTSTVHFEISKIQPINLTATLYANNLTPIQSQINTSPILLETLPNYVLQAFISIEDKDFYAHKGIHLKRMAKALIENTLSRQRKQGASTISQQLIKNTHLSSEKTVTRKLKELKLALEMERSISKNQILQAYLNQIYYGSGCYGIGEAANFYFSCEPSELTVGQAALLAGMIKAPGFYSPIHKPEQALARRNLVLSQMAKDGFISKQLQQTECEKPIMLSISPLEDDFNSYTREALREAEKVLGLSKQQIAAEGLKIYTYYDNEKQLALKQSIKAEQVDVDFAALSISNQTGGVSAYYSNFSYPMEQVKRQPGSAIKPVLVYGPALNNNHIAPITQLLDEKISYEGYSPQNITKTFDGYVSAQEALARSLNVPAVKVMSYAGIEQCKKYAEELGIPFDEKDNGYSIALGGFTTGTNLLQLANAYLPFSNSGKFWKARFIQKIVDDNGTIYYENYAPKKEVFRSDTAYLMSTMLNTNVKETTAKVLGTLPFETYAKTGTVGTKDGKQNTDANCVAYTEQDTVAVWMGNLDNKPMSNYITGGRQPANAIANYYKNIYQSNKPSKLQMPNTVTEQKIDSIELTENHKVVLASEYTPERYTQSELFSVFALPKSTSKRFTKIDAPKLSGKVVNSEAVLEFFAENYFTYSLYKQVNNKTVLINKFESATGTTSFRMPIISGESARYYLEANLTNTKTNEVLTAKSNTVNLLKPKTTTDKPKPNAKWYL